MGPVTFRTYHQVDGADQSGLAGQVDDQRRRVTARMATVRRVVAVMSGKGGVGKSYITARLARGLAAGGRAIGVLDADLRSPTVARTLAAMGPLTVEADAVTPAWTPEGIRVISTDLLLAEGQPLRWHEPQTERFIWRGVLETGTLREFLADVAWGALDYLLVDLPPGADGVADLHALVPGMAGAVAVTIPSDESRRSVARTMQSAREAGIPLLGLVENMAGYRCAECGRTGALFGGDAAAHLTSAFKVPLLGSLPFAPGPLGPHRDLAVALEEVCA